MSLQSHVDGPSSWWDCNKHTGAELMYLAHVLYLQVNKKFRKFEMKYRDCIKRNRDKIGTQTCYEISM